MKAKPLIFLILIIVIAVGAFFIGSKYGKQPVQTASVSEVATSTEMGTDNDGMEDEHAFLQADYNFDGIPDRLEMLDCGATGNCSYEVQLYDSKTKTYMPTIDATVAEEKVNFEVTNPVVNKEEKLVCSYSNVGSGSYHMIVYAYSVKDNTYTQARDYSGSRDKVHACTLM